MKDDIQGLKHRYCWAFDAGDLDALMGLFTDDAVYELGAFGPGVARRRSRPATASRWFTARCPVAACTR